MLLIIRQATADKSRGLLGYLMSTNHNIEGICVLGNEKKEYGYGVPTIVRSLSRDVPGESWPVISLCEELMRDVGVSPDNTLLVSENDDARMLMASIMLDCHYASIEEVTQLYG
jgi:hypothetical protein